MNNTVIRIEDLSKLYKLGEIGTGTLSHDLNRWWARLRGKEDPYSKIGQNNDQRIRTETDYVWALKDINLEVKQGEILGIIGRNGAGKSTLLKLISRITSPTKGSIKMKGRIASLLEVGTGFHPELTGRENIFMNGTILGMSRNEIRQNIDDIIEFSEVESYIDTPVKRYSSGMHVRLAFAVAAHLEPEILIVDEVLAVGDLAFQKKCLGRMETVAKTGRTVLFVSHNIGMIRTLCNRCILLEDGRIRNQGITTDVLQYYLSTQNKTISASEVNWHNIDSAPGSEGFRIRRIRLLGSNETSRSTFTANEPVTVDIFYNTTLPFRGMRIVMQVLTADGIVAFTSTDYGIRSSNTMKPGSHFSRCTIPPNLLNEGAYIIHINCGIPGVKVLMEGQSFLTLTLEGRGANSLHYPEKWPGVVAPELKWEVG